MLVDVQVALDVAGDVDQRMAAELLYHMIKEPYAGRHIIGAGAIKVDLNPNVGLVSLAGDFAKPAGGGAHNARL